MSKYDVVSICNALVDILVPAQESDIEELGLTKGRMHLVDAHRQEEVLKRFSQVETTTELGGSSLNAIRTLAALGLKTSFAGMVGEDAFGNLIKSKMKDLGILPQLGISTEATGTCLILVTPDGERTMNTNLGASRLFDGQLVPEGAIKNAEIFHFCGYQWDTDGQIEAILKACKIAKQAGTRISFDVADPFVIERHKEPFLDVIQEFADVVFANKDEAHMMFGVGPEQAAEKMAAYGCIAVVKKGGEGAVIGERGRLTQIPPHQTTVVDTTAAGDMFAAGVLCGLAKGLPLQECGHMGSLLASDVISRVGAAVSKEALSKATELTKS